MRSGPGSSDAGDLSARLGKALTELDEDADIAFIRLFYLSTSPSFFPVIAKMLGDRGLHRRGGSEGGMVVGEPFGTRPEAAPRAHPRPLLGLSNAPDFRSYTHPGQKNI